MLKLAYLWIQPFFDPQSTLKEFPAYLHYLHNAYTAGLWTDPAIVSLYTGLYPSQHRILAGIDTQPVKRTLADVLSANGYETVMIGTGSVDISQERSIVRGFDTTIDTFDIKRVLSGKRLLSLGSRRWEVLRGSGL